MGKKYFLGAIALGAMILAAHADIIPTLSNVMPSGSNFQWNYASNVTVNQMVTTGDWVTPRLWRILKNRRWFTGASRSA